MTRETPNLSDWIHFLNSVITLSTTIIIGTMSILVLLTVSLYLFTDWAQMILIPFITIIILFVYWFIYGRGSLYTKSRVFLREIMKGTKTNPEIIRNEWFQKREKKMFKDISVIVWKEIRATTLTAGIGIFVIGLFLMKFGIEFFPTTSIQWLTSFGVAILALGVAFHSIVISKESDEKMTTIANANFLEALNDFEQTRVRFIGPSPAYSVQLFIWRSRTIVELASEYNKDIIKTEHQKRLYFFFVVSIRELFARHTWNKFKSK